MATQRGARFYNPDEAVRLAKRACELNNHQNPNFLDTLSVAFAAGGDFPDAIATAKRALIVSRSSNKKELEKKILSRLRLYNTNRPYIDPGVVTQ